MSFDFLQDKDSLRLNKFYLDTYSILDELYRQVLAEPWAIGLSLIPSLRPISLDFEPKLSEGKTLLDIGEVCNIADPQLVKRCLQEYSCLFYIKTKRDGAKCILTYHAPNELRNFFFDPGRSRHLYSAPWIIEKCWDNLQCALGMQLKFNHYCFDIFDISEFFVPSQGRQIPSATLMISQSIKNGSDMDALLWFLKFLSRIRWLDCFGSPIDRTFTKAIAQWVCTALVS